MSLLKDHLQRRARRSRESLKDEYQRYCQLEPEEVEWVSSLAWWKAHEKVFPRLAQMARDIFSIPAMSAEVERLFSSTKLMLPPARNVLLPDGIEAGECIRSWTLQGLIGGNYFEYLSKELWENEHYRAQS